MRFQKMNEFWLKLIALALMTLDHVGAFMMMFAGTSNMSDGLYICGFIFRCVGRLAFPLFIFMLVEGIRHSHNIPLYLLRIAIIMSVIIVGEVIINYCFMDISTAGAYSPFIDLFISGLVLYLLHRKDKWSLFVVLPVAFIILTTAVQIIEISQQITITWLPFYLRPNYSILGLVLSLGFYYATSIARKIVKTNPEAKGLDFEMVEKTAYFRGLVNLLCAGILFVVMVIIYLISNINVGGIYILDIYSAQVETWAILACFLLVLYNGRRGYNAKWFQYGCYIYFPVHIAVIAAIFYVIFMV